MGKKENGHRKRSLLVEQQTSHAPDNVSIEQQIKWETKVLPEAEINASID